MKDIPFLRVAKLDGLSTFERASPGSGARLPVRGWLGHYSNPSRQSICVKFTPPKSLRKYYTDYFFNEWTPYEIEPCY